LFTLFLTQRHQSSPAVTGYAKAGKDTVRSFVLSCIVAPLRKGRKKNEVFQRGLLHLQANFSLYLLTEKLNSLTEIINFHFFFFVTKEKKWYMYKKLRIIIHIRYIKRNVKFMK
jgi:hypothetical protein